MCAWKRPIFTDSGGFQAFSLIRQNPKYGQITEKGLLFRPEGSQRKILLTPEKSIQLQWSYGADVLFCLDECTHPEDPITTQQESVRRTIGWARRCWESFQRLLEQRGDDQAKRPLLFAIIQGGTSLELRKRCAEALLELGFDGFGYGGWPLDSQGELLVEWLARTRELIPPEFPMHALGIGHPESVVTCAQMGYHLFDSAMPTRDARHGRLYAWTTPEGLQGEWFTYVYIQDKKHLKSSEPVSPFCDCHCCIHYSLGYLHHLFKIQDSLFLRLATIHNLRFMTQLMERLRAGGGKDTQPEAPTPNAGRKG